MKIIGVGDNIWKKYRDIGIRDNIEKIYQEYWEWRQYWENLSNTLGLKTISGKYIEKIGIVEIFGKYIESIGISETLLGKIYQEYRDWRQCWEKISRVWGLETILVRYIKNIGIGEMLGKYIESMWIRDNIGEKNKNIGIGDNVGKRYQEYWD